MVKLIVGMRMGSYVALILLPFQKEKSDEKERLNLKLKSQENQKVYVFLGSPPIREARNNRGRQLCFTKTEEKNDADFFLTK